MGSPRLPALALLAALAGCSSGGTPTTPNPPPPPPGNAPVAAVAVTPGSAQVAIGATTPLAARLTDASGNTLTGRVVTWATGNAALATVNSAGVVTGVAAGGPVTITATSEGISGTATVTVTPPLPARIALTWSSSYLLTGDTLQVSARVVDGQGNPIAGSTPTWSATGGAAQVDGQGTVTATVAGTATIVATLGNVNAQVTVHVGVGSGIRIPELSAIDSLALLQLSQLGIPGMSVAVTRDGKLLLARAYGYADTTTRRVAKTSDLWRIGSVSKPITAMGVMKLVEQGKVSLDDHPFTELTNLTPIAGTEDPRLANVTVRDLLAHQGGYNASRNIDDTTFAFLYRTDNTDPTMLVRGGLAVALATDPGTAYAYTNYEYLVLGRVIEHATGQAYQPWMQANITGPAGAADMKFGVTPRNLRDPNEVSYYDTRAPITGLYGVGSWPDVGGGMEYSEASGQWLASATDLARLLVAVDGLPNRADLLSANSIATMWALPPGPAWPGLGSDYYALGWEATVTTGGYTMNHAGGQDGGDGYIAHRADGVGIAFITNLTRGQETGGVTPENAMNAVLDHVTTWPTRDLFP